VDVTKIDVDNLQKVSQNFGKTVELMTVL